jgi:cell wall-associated NlpC family hydrolase
VDRVPIQPGDIGLVTTTGPGPRMIRLGDWIYAKRVHTRHELVNHVAVAIGHGLAVAANPSGAAVCSATSWRTVEWRTYRRPLTSSERDTLAKAAEDLVGVPYSWLDIACLTLEQLGADVQHDDGKPTAIGRRITSDRRLVCSQLAAKVYADCGLPLFLDRSPGEVTPGDLARSPLLVPVA